MLARADQGCMLQQVGDNLVVPVEEESPVVTVVKDSPVDPVEGSLAVLDLQGTLPLVDTVVDSDQDTTLSSCEILQIKNKSRVSTVNLTIKLNCGRFPKN